MCGIFVCHKSYGTDFIGEATSIISKRGNDCVSSIEFDGYIFLHSRLIITGDRDNGHQPLETSSSIFLFNGEVYNYRYLNELLDEPFVGSYSDSQVIHACIIKFGFDIIDCFDGPFAIVHYDKATKSLRAFRDHLGEKPLFYFDSENRKIYSSDLKVFKHLEQTSTISNSSLFEYLSMGYVPSLNTIFSDVSKVRPWKTERSSCFIDYKIHVEKKYGKSLSSKLLCIADQFSYQNAALLLSGGVDSTLVGCYLKNSNIHLYTTKFLNDENDESVSASSTAKHLGLPITEVDVPYNIDANLLNDLVSSLNEPVGDPGIINQFHSLKKVCEDGRKVVFVGTGGDEMFFGYPRYRLLPLKLLIDLLPKSLVSFVERFLLRLCTSDLTKNRIIKFLSEDSAVFRPEFDLRNYLPNQLFSTFDSLSLNNGLEARTPFTSILLLDHAVTSRNAAWLDFLIPKFKLKIILLQQFRINKFFVKKRGFTNDYSRFSIDERYINFSLFADEEGVRTATRRSHLHLFRVFVLSRWLEC